MDKLISASSKKLYLSSMRSDSEYKKIHGLQSNFFQCVINKWKYPNYRDFSTKLGMTWGKEGMTVYLIRIYMRIIPALSPK